MDFNVNPYFDDYDPSKGYYKILVRPSFAVQAREVNQIQTMLQEQIHRFGNHVFEEGSVVTGAQHSLDLDVTYIKLQEQFAGQPINVNNFLDNIVRGQVSGAEGRVVFVSAKDDTDPDTLFVKIHSGTFVDGEQLVAQTTLASALAAPTTAVGKSSFVGIAEGVYFINGFFTLVNKQLLVLDKYSNTPSYRIGLTAVETIITEEDDDTLLDNATGAPNYLAPGSHRYQISMLLQKRSLAFPNLVENNAAAKFVEILRIENGIRLKDVNYTQYSDLEDNLARRTKDESGDYTIEPFQIDLANDVDPAKILVGMEPGKAYVSGYEHRTIATEYVEVDRGRDTQEVNNYDINAQYGNYAIVNSVHGLFDPTVLQEVKLLNTNVSSTNGGNFTNNTIGTALLRAVEFHATGKYKFYLFGIQFTAPAASFKDVKSIWTGIYSDERSANIDITEGMNTNSEALLLGSAFNTMIFNTPNTAVQTLRPGGNTDTQYETKKSFNVSFVAGIAAINVTGTNTFFGATGTLAPDVVNQNYTVVLTNVASAGATGLANGDVVDMNVSGRSVTLSGGTQTATFDIDDNTFAATGTIIATVNLNEKGEKTKTLTVGVDSAVVLVGDRGPLTRADIFAITSIVDAGNSNVDVTAKFDLDNGQRDNLYDLGAITLKAGQTVVGPLNVTYQYFTHSGSGYFSVDSYTSAIAYEDIPTFASSTGQVYNLRDVLDFRPRRATNSSAVVIPAGGVDLPRPNTNISSDYIFYLPRIDKVVLKSTRSFGVIRGVSSLNPITPPDDDDAMTLYVISIPAYTNSVDDCKITYVDNRRYTMKDIGELDRRLNTVEYYTALSLLEKDTKDLTIVDDDGIEQFKSGILVDSFSGHGIGDVVNPDYQCAIDFENGVMRPKFVEQDVDFTFNPAGSTNAVLTGDIVSLAYSTALYITQPLQSTTVNANPFNITPWNGGIHLTPETDNWFDTTTQPKVVTNNDGENDAWKTSALGFGTQWNDWVINWAGDQVIVQGLTTDPQAISREASDVSQSQTRQNISARYSPQAILRKVGTRVVNESIVPFIRAQTVTFTSFGMKPNTRVYPFFDGVDVAAYCRPNVLGSALGDPLVTNAAGQIVGIFELPNSSTLRFKTGERLFRLTDSISNILQTTTTVAEHRFVARGLISTREDGVTSTRPHGIRRSSSSDTVLLRDPVTREQISSDNTVTQSPWLDPIAQTFTVDSKVFKNGVTLKSLQLFFASKDPTLPIVVEIRPTINGFPHSSVAIPFTQVVLNSSQVSVSQDGSIGTTVDFAAPVFLTPGKYAITLITNSNRYTLFAGQKGQNVFNTQRLITKQPYVDQLFLPQNISEYLGDTDVMLMFNLNRCVFVDSGTAAFNNVTPNSDVVYDTLYLTTGQITTGQIGVNFAVKTKDQSSGNVDSTFGDVVSDTNISFDNRKFVDSAVANTLQIQATVTTPDDAVSPLIDLQRFGAFAVANTINNDVAGETGSFGGNAQARYITRRVTLKDGFDANGMRVYVNAYKSSQNNIRVYYKVLAADDGGLFDDKLWVEMTQLTNAGVISLNEQDFKEFQFEANNIAYDGFTDFSKFAIKIVLTTADTTDVPQLTDFRAIALRS